MTEEQKTSTPAVEEQTIRHDLVSTAVNFLLNPAVINKPYIHKTAFLKKKGLTDAEISLAYKQAESDPKHDAILRQSNSTNVAPLPPPVPIYKKSVSYWSQISKFSSSLIILGVALFGAHYIYKTYIEPLLFEENSEKKKSQLLQNHIIEMATSLSKLEKQISSLDDHVQCQKLRMDKFLQSEVNEYYPTPLALRELKTELAAIKSLLLNRHQFPAMPKVTPAMPKITPAIPAWQLPSNENKEDTVKQNGNSSEPQYPDEQRSSKSKSSSGVNSEDDDVVEVPAKMNTEPKSIKNEHLEELKDDVSLS